MENRKNHQAEAKMAKKVKVTIFFGPTPLDDHGGRGKLLQTKWI